jgi:hypothetical protein
MKTFSLGLLLFCFGIIKQLKYTIEGVSKIPAPLGFAEIPGLVVQTAWKCLKFLPPMSL